MSVIPRVIQLNRIMKWYGGMTIGDIDKSEGVCQNIEEFDIFTNVDFMQPNTIFSADAVITRLVSGYAKDDLDQLFAAGRDASGTPNFQIWKKTTASQNVPGAWASYYTSTVQATSLTPIIWHQWDAGTKWLYIVTGDETTATKTIYRVSLPTNATVSSTDSGSTTMTMSKYVGTGGFDRVPVIRFAGQLFFGNGNFIEKIDATGVFFDKAFQLPRGWVAVSFASIGDELAILARSVELGENTSKVFFWDTVATTGVDDEATIPMGGPQILVNHNEVLRVFCASNGILRIYQLNGKFPTKTHELANVGIETDLQPVIPDNSKFIKNNIVYFSLFKTDKSGLYALGQVDDSRPLALVLDRRFTTTDYSLHKPLASYATGANYYLSYDDNGTKKVAKLEGNNSPSRSNNAVYESILLDANSPESSKEWFGVFVITKPISNSTQNVKIDCRVDNAGSYDANSLFTLDTTNDQEYISGAGVGTYWYRDWPSVVGRMLQLRIRCTSSTTNAPAIYVVSVLSRSIPYI